MILPRILDHDLHGSKNNERTPLWVEIPSSPDFLPCIVSSSRSGSFLISRKLTKEGKVRTGIFSHPQDSIDQLISPLFSKAYELSVLEDYKNRFTLAHDAFRYIQTCGESDTLPHCVLVPDSFSESKIRLIFGTNYENEKYANLAKIFRYSGDKVVFLSRPDYVGLYTAFMNSKGSLLLHNVKLGVAFLDNV